MKKNKTLNLKKILLKMYYFLLLLGIVEIVKIYIMVEKIDPFTLASLLLAYGTFMMSFISRLIKEINEESKILKTVILRQCKSDVELTDNINRKIQELQENNCNIKDVRITLVNKHNRVFKQAYVLYYEELT
ncbi:hypothetical protein JQ032_01270 [Clostridium botulinum]|nr:hypothetical protein [Clostridium botulinum]MCS4474869.1 hypothetical protein [Clostridium botulinum]